LLPVLEQLGADPSGVVALGNDRCNIAIELLFARGFGCIA
jgi:hypothetical protein